jgi:hypothetical protein
MGVGVNVQDKLIAIHHLDAPHRPMDIEQRNGRIFRTGNENLYVHEFRYGVKNTLDSSAYQRLAIKLKMYKPILRGDISVTELAEDDDLGFDEQMAAYSGNPLAMEKLGVEHTVRSLEEERVGFYRQVSDAQDRLGRARKEMPDLERKIVTERKDLAAYRGTVERDAWGVVDGVEIQDHEVFMKAAQGAIDLAMQKGAAQGAALYAEDKKKHKTDSFVFPGPALRPWGMQLDSMLVGVSIGFDGKVDADYTAIPYSGSHGLVSLGGRVRSAVGLVASLKNAVERATKEIADYEERLGNLKRDVPVLEAMLGKSWEKEKDLAAARARMNEIEKELAAQNQDPHGGDVAKGVDDDQAPADGEDGGPAGTVSASPGVISAMPGLPGEQEKGFRAPAEESVVDDRNFSVLPVEMPEAVELARQLMGGRYPVIRGMLRALHGEAAGIFRGSGPLREIELRADIFELVQADEKSALRWHVVNEVLGEAGFDPDGLTDEARQVLLRKPEIRNEVEQRYEGMLTAAVEEAKKRDPTWGLAVLTHEIGHLVDFIPHATLSRGNILGHVAALRTFQKQAIGEAPATAEAGLDGRERSALRRLAEKQAKAELGESAAQGALQKKTA